MSKIVNRRNALFGWAAWAIVRGWAARRAGRPFHREPPRWRRWLRRLGTLVAALLAALGVLALWRKLRGGEDEWVVPEPVDVDTSPAEPAPLASVEPDDVPPAA